MKKMIKEHWYLSFYLLFALIALLLRPLTGEEVVSYPWDTLSFIFLFLMTAEGIRKEKLALPIFRVLNSLRSTCALIILILFSGFLLTLFIPDSITLMIMLPFTEKLLDESNKTQYKVPVLALLTLLTEITGIVTPFSLASIPLFYNRETSFSVYALPLLTAFGVSIIIFAFEVFILFRKTKGDVIYLHMEKEDYWESDRKGKRILYPAFLLVLLFGRRFNTIDLLLVISLAYIILDREIYKVFNWPVFITIALIVTSSYTIGKIIPEGRLAETIVSILFTRTGAVCAYGNTASTVINSLPSAILTFPLPLISALRCLKEERKAFIKEYILISFPVLAALFLLSALLG